MAFPRIGKTLLGAAALALPGLALAHTGADGGAHHLAGFGEGLAHPFTGMDHLAAMVAVGIWSAMTARRAWIAPLSFASLVLAGALMGIANVALPAVEPMIAASLLVLGLLVATRASLPAGAGAVLAGGFALFHGLAHGTELTAAHSVAGALAGMVLGTALLHVAGLAIGHAMLRANAWWPRLLGGGVALLGAGFFTGMA
ncbi:HupE/UreJ family protein [Uliginosibacterium sp. sgz301328]|uniref:HupE/UreJ family protein n=1 Tax=Uliginosibacterium sp. sgz301328 TaxID=3243764 RepID=UPI00359EB474